MSESVPKDAAAAAARLAALGDDFFQVVHSINPLTATELGVAGFDDLLPDPSRDGAADGARRLTAIEKRLAGIDAALLDDGPPPAERPPISPRPAASRTSAGS